MGIEKRKTSDFRHDSGELRIFANRLTSSFTSSAWPLETHRAFAFRNHATTFHLDKYLQKATRNALPSAKSWVCSMKTLSYRCSKAIRACAESKPGKDFSRCSDRRIGTGYTENKLLTYFQADAKDARIISIILSRKIKNHYKIFVFYLPYILIHRSF